MLSHEDAWALFERRRRAWLDEDLPGYLALWTEDMTFQSPMHAEPLRKVRRTNQRREPFPQRANQSRLVHRQQFGNFDLQLRIFITQQDRIRHQLPLMRSQLAHDRVG